MANQTKAERKAALKAAKAAAKVQNKETSKVVPEVKAETKPEVKPEVKEETTPVVETKKEEKTPQVDNKKKEVKSEMKPEVKKEAPKALEKPKKSEKIPTIIPEDASDAKSPQQKAIERASNLISTVSTAGIPVGSTSSSLDGKAMLAFVMQQRYANNEKLASEYPELHADISHNIDVITLLALVDIRQDLFNRGERKELELITDANQILRLQSMAEILGIKLAPAKALPGGDSNQLSINFTKSEVPEELTKDAGKPINEIPELDPNKINTDKEIDTALTYLAKKEKNVAVNIVNTVEWYRNLCCLKEDDAAKKLALTELSTEEWIQKTFERINAKSLIQGLGQAVYLYTSQTGSPCLGHSVLHRPMSGAGWSEEDIACALKALISENFRYKQKDNPELKATEDKALRGIIKSLGSDYIDQLIADYTVDLSGVEEAKKNELEDRKKVARTIIGSVRTNYFDIKKSPSIDELRMKIGQIINLYRDPAERLAEYCQEQLSPVVEKEYPEKETEKKK